MWRWGVAVLVALVVLAAQASAAEVDTAGTDHCFCRLTGVIDDCCCSIEDVNRLNAHVLPLASRLGASTFFRFYKVNMNRPCRFWRHETAGCRTSHCSVVPCEDADVPQALRSLEELPFDCMPREASPLGELRDTVTSQQLEELASWQEFDHRNDNFCDTDEENGDSLEYVNLVDNPERFTGYTGNSPAQIWRAIYSENCFKPEDETVRYLTSNVVNDMCMEKRVFYRVVSGLHAAINIHVASHYPKSSLFGVETWGPNVTLFERFFHPAKTFGEGPNWLKNVYFTYLMLVRAVTKASPMWQPMRFHTGDPDEDQEVSSIVSELINAAPRTCPSTFDESLMFHGPDSDVLKSEFRTHFRNISLIMDCVECSTCRLWGKLKVHGLGTAMKILFSDEGPDNYPRVRLQRNEVVALFNTLAQFSQAIDEINSFKKLMSQEAAAETLPFG